VFVVQSLSKLIVQLIEFVGLVEIASKGVKPRLGYSSLQSQLSVSTPETLQIDQYQPAYTAATSCERFNYQDKLSASPLNQKTFATNLPTKPNRQLCSCMMKSLHCVANYTILQEPVKDLPTPTDFVQSKRRKYCNENRDLCRAIEGDSVAGEYGSYIMCNATEKGSWVLNRLHSDQKGTTCTSEGGLIQEPKPLSPECKILLDQAGPNGTGVVTYIPEEKYVILKGSKPLQTGAKVGIVFGVLVALVLTVGLIICIRLRTRRMKFKATQQVQELSATMGPSKKEAKESKSSHITHEIDGIELQELSASSTGTELQELSATENELRELEGDGINDIQTVEPIPPAYEKKMSRKRDPLRKGF
jgi:X8 domain